MPHEIRLRPVLWTFALALAASGCGSPSVPSEPNVPTTPPLAPVTGGQWSAAQLVADAGAKPADRCAAQASPCRFPYEQSYPRIAMNARGQTVAAWQRFEGGDYHLVAARHEPSREWTAETPVHAGSGAREPMLAADAQGNALLVWRNGSDLLASSGPVSGAWSEPQALVAGDFPLMAMDDSGRAWLSFVQAGVGIAAMRFTPGGWAAPEIVQADDPSDRLEIQATGLALAPDGGALATWIRADPGDEYRDRPPSSELWSSRAAPGRAWSPPSLTSSLDGVFAFDLQSVASDLGGAVAFTTFGEQDTYRWEVWGQNTPPGAPAWLPPLHLSGPLMPRPPTTLKQSPRMGTAGSADAMLVWVEQQDFRDPTTGSSSARARSPANAALVRDAHDPQRGRRAGRRGNVHVAASAAGNAVATWTELAGLGVDRRLMASHFVPGTGWASPQAIRTGSLSGAVVAMDASGNAEVVWSDWTGERLQVWSARLTATR